MGWQKFTVQSSKPAGTGLKVTLRKAKQGPAAMGLTLLPEAARALDWADGDKLEVMVGEGAHHGLLRLRKNNSTGTAVVQRKDAIHDSHYFKVSLGAVPGFVNRAEAARWAKFERDSEMWVEIVLPLWAAETAPQATAVPAPKPTVPSIAAAANFQRPKRDAAPSLMGDPPRERSALGSRG